MMATCFARGDASLVMSAPTIGTSGTTRDSHIALISCFGKNRDDQAAVNILKELAAE